MTEPIRIAGVCERDLDLLLFEELYANREFRNRLLVHADLGSARQDRAPSVRRGVTHSTGESDLELDVVLTDGRVATLLIENKVDAALQVRQAERYAQRAAAYIADGKCEVAKTMLIAPERYVAGADDDVGFDASLTYEAISRWIGEASESGPRLAYKQALVAAAIEKGVLGYQPVADDAMTALWAEYGAMVQALAPELNMPDQRSLSTSLRHRVD